MTWRLSTRFRRLLRCRAFLDHDGGGVTIFAVIGFSMLLVLIGLIADVGRVMNVHTETSSYADRAALAAAAELDGRDPNCAIPNAIAAVTGVEAGGCNFERLLPSGRRFTLSGDHFVRVQRMTFYSSLNPDNVTARWERGNSGPVYTVGRSNANRNTRFVRVETTGEREQFLFFSLFGGELDSATVAPRATAGFERRVCNTAPLMVCNPDEGSGAFNPQRGRDFRASLHYTNQYFNWLEDREYTLLNVQPRSPQALGRYLRQSNPGTQCYGPRVSIIENFGREQREAIHDALRDREGDTIPAAIVNCRQHRNRLNGSQANDPIPVEAWALLEIEDAHFERHDVPVRHDHFYVDFEVRGLMPADHNVAREYPVLVR